MKKITGLVVILAVLVLGGYYVTGMFTEKKVKESIELVNRTNGIYVEVKNYDRGWFDSSANLVWHFQFPNKQTSKMETTEFNMPLKVYHGPFMFTDDGMKVGMGYAHSMVQMPDKNLKQMKELFTDQSTAPTLNLSLFVNLIGKTSFNAAVPDFTLIAKKGGGKLDWDGLDSSIQISSDMKSFEGYFNIAGFTFSQKDISAKMEAVKTIYHLYENGDGLFLGSASVNFPSLLVKQGDKTLFALSKFDMKSGSTQDGDVINSDLSITLDKIVANNETYGPGELHFMLSNLDSKALARINELAQQAQNATEEEKKQLLVAMMPEVPKLLSHGAQIQIDPFSFKLPNGKIEGNLLISLPKGSFDNPFDMVRQIEGNGRLSVPADLVREAMAESLAKTMMSNQLQQAIAQQNNANGIQPMDAKQQAQDMVEKKLATLVDKGLLTKEGNDYVIAFTLKDGKLMVNGAPFNPAMMQF
ncbi:YdgA family protein [Legionella sp. W05-934-2]|jgi:uncharacterized protein YdgA (DUF945 family)|uniref:YdgA family protein n=1 Tax=Legionella sp. W05-934-2 TaxID=1198649 RepID=UPI0034618484